MRRIMCLVVLLTIQCKTIPPQIPEVLTIQSMKEYGDLDKESLNLANKIMKLAAERPNKNYYFEKLTILLKTPYRPTLNKKINRAYQKDAIRTVSKSYSTKNKKDLERHLNIEEDYEKSKKWKWFKVCGRKSYNKHYYVTRDPLNILVKLYINLVGKQEDVKKVFFLEDATEKHLSIPGFSVNIEFYREEADDVNKVDTNPSNWVTATNWSGSYTWMAHEAMHLLGVDDEYDRLESHYNNKGMKKSARLYWFYYQMTKGTLDSKDGIMYRDRLKPLDRHVCAIASLGEDCIKKRMEYYHGKK